MKVGIEGKKGRLEKDIRKSGVSLSSAHAAAAAAAKLGGRADV